MTARNNNFFDKPIALTNNLTDFLYYYEVIDKVGLKKYWPEPHGINCADNSMADWTASEKVEVDAGKTLYLTWDNTNIY